jgi:hypothetical protein
MNWTRREFLTASAAVPLITIETRATPSNTFTEHERNVLRAAMDEVIPASDGMPAASEVSGVAYMERIAGADADVANEIRAALAALQKTSEQPLDRLGHDARVMALKNFEAADPNQFAHLRDYVYESYYTQPAVWKLIGYEFYPTDHAGPHMEPFDDSILAEVRKRPRLYREA